jgi:alanine racemase
VTADIWSVPGRSTRAVVDLDAIAGNLQRFRAGVSPSTRLMAVVKANGYGHGAVMVARAALDAGATDLAVATVDEGLQLRKSGIRAPILILGPIDDSEFAAAIAGNLSLVVASCETVRSLASAVTSKSAPTVSVHLKIDTGMGRYGAPPALGAPIASLIASLPALHLAGTMTHFASADETDEATTLDQLGRFDATLEEIRGAGVDPGHLHVANSAATLRSRRYDRDMVRIGIAMYGIPPSSDIALWSGMKPALTLHSRVRRMNHLRSGDRVSYGGTYQAMGDESAALIPIGYADGYHRLLSNQAWMAIGDDSPRIRGRVCMDQTVVGWTSHVPVEVGAHVVVVGDGSDSAPTLAELAEIARTIPYELATSIAPRVPRIYIKNHHVVAVEDLAGLREAAK